MDAPKRRFFIGNLFKGATPKDVADLFSRYGRLDPADVEIKTKLDAEGEVLTTFAFVDIRGLKEGDEPRIIKECNGIRWKKHVIKVQVAQESFLQRLQRERAESAKNKALAGRQFSTDPDPSYNPLDIFRQKQNNRDNSSPATEKVPLREPDSADKVHSKRKQKTPEKSPKEPATPGKVHKKKGFITFDDDQDQGDSKNTSSRAQYHSSSEDDDDHRSHDKPKNVPLVPVVKAFDVNESSYKRKYEESSDDEEERHPKKPPQKQAKAAQKLPTRKYYSSSDEEDDRSRSSKKRVQAHSEDQVMNQLESFNSGVWRDDDDADKAAPGQAKKPILNSNDRRLESLKSRQNELKKNQSIMKSALANLEGRKQVKKFTDQAQKPQQQQQLFSDDDDDEDSDDVSAFQLQTQFEGQSGQKLLELQSRFASDDRFKLDRRFKDDDGEDVTNDDGAEVEAEVTEERQRNMSILDAMLGSSSEQSNKKSRPGLQFKDSTKRRFDPDEPAKNVDSLDAHDDDDDDNRDEASEAFVAKETPMPEVSTDKSYSIQTDLFSKGSTPDQGASGFTFGFGQAEQALKKKRSDQPGKAEVLQPKKKKRLSHLEQNPFKYDSSDTEEEQEQETTTAAATAIDTFNQQLATKAAETSSSLSLKEPVFLQPGDARLEQEVSEWLEKGRAESQDVLRARHEEARPVLAAILKKKLKSRAKRQQKMSFGTVRAGSKKRKGAFWKSKKKTVVT